MNRDPIIEEVRDHRAEILRLHGGSMIRHHKEIQRTQSDYGERLVMLPAKRILEPSAAPNGGPATPPANSGVAEGPPSVS